MRNILARLLFLVAYGAIFCFAADDWTKKSPSKKSSPWDLHTGLLR